MRTPWTLGNTKTYSGKTYSFVANFSTKREANRNAKLQRAGGYNVRIWRWKRNDGKVLYAVYIRRGKRFKF